MLNSLIKDGGWLTQLPARHILVIKCFNFNTRKRERLSATLSVLLDLGWADSLNLNVMLQSKYSRLCPCQTFKFCHYDKNLLGRPVSIRLKHQTLHISSTQPLSIHHFKWGSMICIFITPQGRDRERTLQKAHYWRYSLLMYLQSVNQIRGYYGPL